MIALHLCQANEVIESPVIPGAFFHRGVQFCEDGFGNRVGCVDSMACAIEFAIDGYWGGHDSRVTLQA